jgi:hypothetical protein
MTNWLSPSETGRSQQPRSRFASLTLVAGWLHTGEDLSERDVHAKRGEAKGCARIAEGDATSNIVVGRGDLGLRPVSRDQDVVPERGDGAVGPAGKQALDGGVRKRCEKKVS